jgi:hypothetical protein
MTNKHLKIFAKDIASVIPSVDSKTTGQYGDGIGSEDEERQIELILRELRDFDNRYEDVEGEVSYPDYSGKCDLVLPDNTLIEAKLLRYWRANGNPEHYMYSHVFSPFHNNTLMTDAKRLHETDSEHTTGLLGLFYKRSDRDSETVKSLPERYTAKDIAEKVVQDIEYWYDFQASICEIAEFSGLQHNVHKQGAVITWIIE